ncbi:MAG: hypothetical protein ACFCVH_01885 [Alphaproteobacteria bacterium]
MTVSAASIARHRPLSTALALGLLACGGVLVVTPFAEAALAAWLSAAFLWSAMPIGAVGLLMTMRLVPGRWRVELAIPVEAQAVLLPLAALALLPVLFGIGGLYPWADAAPDGFRSAYLQPWFFSLRSALWLGLLGVTSWLLIVRRGRGRAIAAGGLLAYPVLGSLVGVDWLMSREPDFHSSGYGLYVLSIQMTVALLAGCAARLLASRREPRSGAFGALILTALLLWGYLAFMQYFITWSSDKPAGVDWYQARADGVWGYALWALVVLQAAAILLLLDAQVRRSRRWLLLVIGLAFAGKLLESAWLVLPGDDVPALLLTLVAFAGLGTLFVAGLVLALRARVQRRLGAR